MSETDTSLLESWARKSHDLPHPEEACGLLVGLRQGDAIQIEGVVHCQNVAPQPGHSFLVSAKDLMHADHHARSNGQVILGVWHSHPSGDPTPSARDRDELPRGLLGLVIAIGKQGAGTQMRTYGPKNDAIPAPMDSPRGTEDP